MASDISDKNSVERGKPAGIEGPIRTAGRAEHSSQACSRLLHELHELLFGFVHNLGRDLH